VLHRDLHFGIATPPRRPHGAVIHHADRLGSSRSRARSSGWRRARDHKLKLEELQGATFTITSTGARGACSPPHPAPPAVAILGVHEFKKRPAVVDDRIVARDLGNLSLSMDHAWWTGGGRRLLYAVVERLQDPGRLAEGDLG